MKALICASGFYPQIGGLETINQLLAGELSKRGWEVVVITQTAYCGQDSYDFIVVRNPKWLDVLKWYRWSDIIIHSAIVIKYLSQLLFVRKPFVIVHHSCTYNWNQEENWRSRVKRFVSKFANNIAVSEAVAHYLGLPAGYRVINNFYDSAKYRITNHDVRNDFVYVGRLSYEKGLDLLLRAYSKYHEKGGTMKLEIVGDGYLRDELELMAQNLGLCESVSFSGRKNSDELVRILNSKRVLILPSVCKEAFGIVILEAMACGCLCIGSDGDGIEEAMGGIGMTFKKSDADSLAEMMLASDAFGLSEISNFHSKASRYLTSFSLDVIANKYEDYLHEICTNKKASS